MTTVLSIRIFLRKKDVETEKIDEKEAQHFIGVKEDVLSTNDEGGPFIRNKELAGIGIYAKHVEKGVNKNRYKSQ